MQLSFSPSPFPITTKSSLFSIRWFWGPLAFCPNGSVIIRTPRKVVIRVATELAARWKQLNDNLYSIHFLPATRNCAKQQRNISYELLIRLMCSNCNAVANDSAYNAPCNLFAYAMTMSSRWADNLLSKILTWYFMLFVCSVRVLGAFLLSLSEGSKGHLQPEASSYGPLCKKPGAQGPSILVQPQVLSAKAGETEESVDLRAQEVSPLLFVGRYLHMYVMNTLLFSLYHSQWSSWRGSTQTTRKPVRIRVREPESGNG